MRAKAPSTQSYLRSADSSSAATKYLKNRELSSPALERSSVVYTAAAVRSVVVMAVDVEPTTTESVGISSTSGTDTGSEKSIWIWISSLYPKGPVLGYGTIDQGAIRVRAEFLCAGRALFCGCGTSEDEARRRVRSKILAFWRN